MPARTKTPRHIEGDYLRNIMFGFEDALVSTTGVVVGVSAGTSNPSVILLAGLVTVTVEALSMGAGSYLSERAVHQIERSKKKHPDSPLFGGILMFFAYLIAGMIPVIPIILFEFPRSAIFSVIAALTGLFLLGYAKGKIVRVSAVRSGVEIFVVGGLATIVGLIVGMFLKV